jgi:predicted TIM-barrel fold metal-dependent hydrolase
MGPDHRRRRSEAHLWRTPFAPAAEQGGHSMSQPANVVGLQPQSARDLLAGVKVVDTDTHITEWHDLWTSRAPASFKDRVPRIVKQADGSFTWVLGEDHVLNRDSGFAAIQKDGSKLPGVGFRTITINDVHPGAYDVKARLAYMDQQGIAAQIAYTNLLGFGGQKAMTVDPELRLVSTQILNDALAEMQADSNNRIYPMTMMPWWDVKLAVAEAERGAAMGLRGVNMNSGPQSHGLPHLADPYWDPLWEFCQDRGQPVNFHIGASDESMSWYGKGFWPGFTEDMKLAFGTIMLFNGNMQVLVNIMLSGMLKRHPKLKFCSVESGLGWLTFMLESLDYQLTEQIGGKLEESMFETFKRHFYVCGWYEHRGMLDAIRNLGADNIMFETDFPHPTCLYPDALETAAPLLAQMTPEARKKVFQTNAERLYALDLSAAPAAR